MKLQSTFQWLWLYLKIFVLSFVIIGLLVGIFPEFMLQLFGQWALLMQAVGAKSAAQLGTPAEMFRHILTMNAISLGIYMIIGYFLQAPLVIPFTAAFYALVAFLAPRTIGRSFSLSDWVLIGVESLMLLIGASLTAGVAGDLYAVLPNRRSLVQYWKKAWRKLWLRPTVAWKPVLRAWSATLLVGFVVLVVLSIFVAWFEVYGY